MTTKATAIPRRATRTQRSSYSSSTSDSTSSSASNDVLKGSLADYSPSSDTLSLTDETDMESEDEEDEKPEELEEEWDFKPKVITFIITMARAS